MKKQPFSNVFHDLYRKALKHSKYRWVVIFGTLLYLVSPLDISPDVFPVLGWIDDGLVATLLVTEVSSLISENLKRKRKPETAFNTQTVVHLDREGDETVKTITVDAVPVA
ncbi:MAG: YkvA family protein [Phormidesmis sp.]